MILNKSYFKKACWGTFNLRHDKQTLFEIVAIILIGHIKYFTGQAGTMVIAEELEFSTHFVLSLTQSCLRLVEALPPLLCNKLFLAHKVIVRE